MPILFLLIFLNITTPFLCSIGDGHKFGGWRGALIGMVIGLAMSAGNFYAISTAGKACWQWGSRCYEQKRSLYWPTQVMRLLWFAACLWIIASSFLAISITRFVIHELLNS